MKNEAGPNFYRNVNFDVTPLSDCMDTWEAGRYGLDQLTRRFGVSAIGRRNFVLPVKLGNFWG